MDIGPIRNLLAIAPRSAELEPPSIFAVEASSRPGDDASKPGRDKQSSRQRQQEFEEDEFTLSGDDSVPEFSVSAAESGSQLSVNFFA